MNSAAIDKWTFHHFLGGIAVGIVSSIFFPKYKYEVAILTIIGFELVEQNIIASWYKIIPEEPLSNTIIDVVVGGLGAVTAIYLQRGL